MTESWIAGTQRYVQPLERQAPIGTLRLDLRILIRKCISREPDKFLYLRFWIRLALVEPGLDARGSQ